ncbi:MAG: porin family protein [Bacteroidota bacterium]|nr:porin family protein [Bacteroidota bacterium]
MKKKKTSSAIIIFTLLLLSSSICGQTDKTGVSVMPQVGLNLTSLNNEPMLETDQFRVGVEGGFWLQSKKTVFIMPGIFVAQQGLSSVYLEDLQNHYDTILNKVDYRAVKIPVMFGIQALGARIYTGPSFTYILNTDNPEVIVDEFRDLSLGLNVGAGYSFTIFSFDIRYQYGVSHVFRNRDAVANTLTISAGLKF